MLIFPGTADGPCCSDMDAHTVPDEETGLTSIAPTVVSREPQTRDARLWALLWGGPPALRTRTMDWGTYTDRDFAADAAFIASLKPVWDFNGAVGFERVADWELLSSDGNRQQTVFENGDEAEVDFAAGGYRLKVGKKRSKGSFT